MPPPYTQKHLYILPYIIDGICPLSHMNRTSNTLILLRTVHHAIGGKGKFVPVNGINAYLGIEVKFHSFLNSGTR